MHQIAALSITHLGWPRLLGLWLLLLVPVVFAPFMSDDFFHLLMLGETPPLPHPQDGSLYGLFSFISDNAGQRRLLMDQGVLPWWTGDNFYFRFWRPLAEISHRVDFTLAPGQPLLAHLHNLAWFVALASVLRQLYRQQAVQAPVALLAIIIFVLNGSHAPAIAWIANRNALLAACFAFLALYQHGRFRQHGNWHDYLLALLCLVLALLAGESSLAIGGFLFAYAVVMDRAGPLRGFAWLLPYAVIVLGWLLLYRQLGFGANGSGMHYVDALAMPGAFVQAVAERLPVYLLAGFTVLPAELYPAVQLLVPDLAGVVLLLVLLTLFLASLLCWPLLKADRASRFFLLGATLSIVPFCSLANQDRLLLIPSAGFSYVIASMIWQVSLRGLQPFVAGWRNAALRKLVALLVLMHLLLAPLYLLAAGLFIHADARRTVASLQALPAYSMAARHLVILKGPMLHSALLKPVRQLASLDVPDQVLLLATPSASLQLERVDLQHLLIRRDGGFVQHFEQSFRDLDSRPFAVGDVIETTAMRLEVLAVNARGQPLELAAELHDAPQYYRFLVYQPGHGLVPVDLPAVGGQAAY
ncbi:MAG TPA: hypothetical protein VIN71_12620 [Pseudomonadales bacterium]